MTTMTPAELLARLPELRALEDAATKGPWRQGALDMSAVLWSDELHRNGYAKQIATTGPKEDWRGAVQQADDAALIVAMRNSYPALLTLIETQSADIARRDAALAEIANPTPSEFEFPADWSEQIAACEICQSYANHPIQRGICDTHRRPLWDRERHDSDEEKRLGWRAKNIANRALTESSKS